MYDLFASLVMIVMMILCCGRCRWNVLGELLPLFLHFNKFSTKLIAQHSLEQLLSLTSSSVTAESHRQLIGQHKVLGEKLESGDMSHYHMHIHKQVENFFGSMHGTVCCAVL